MRLIHCADLHLGSSLTANFEPDAAAKRSAELFRTFTDLLKYADENDIAAVLISGDLFDRDYGIRGLKENVLRAVSDHPRVNVYYLRGNHDRGTDTSSLPVNLYLFTEECCTYTLGAAERITISGIEPVENRLPEIPCFPSSSFNVLMLHGQLREGTAPASEYDIPIGTVANRNIDYLAMGHLHSHREGKIDERGVYVYPGCLEGRGFDETGVHGFELLEIDEDHLSCSHRFIPFARRMIYREEINVSDCLNSYDIVRRIRERIAAMSASAEDIACFDLTGEVETDCEIDETLIKEQISDAFSYVRLRNMTVPAVDYERFLDEESLRGEFVRLVMADAEMNADEKKAVLRQGFGALTGREDHL